MGEVSNSVMLASVELRAQIPKNLSIQDRFRAIAKKAQNHWLLRDEEDRFKAAVGAVLLSYQDQDHERGQIEHEMRVLGTLSAAQHGIPVDLGALMTEDAPEPIGLMGLWHEHKGARLS